MPKSPGSDELQNQAAEAQTTRRTLFFNLSHEHDSATSTYYLVAGKQRYRLRRLDPGDGLLARERTMNAFLRGVPDSSLTHVLENADLAAGVQLCYTVKNPDTAAGTWSMSSMNIHIPDSGVSYAYRLARERITQGPLPLSSKRRLYGHKPAETLQDVLDERALVDITDHASTLIGFHPNMLSYEPNSAGHIQSNWIQPNGITAALAVQIQGLGAAQPQQTPGTPNSNGWATLVPLINDQTNQPFRNQNGNNKGLIQYTPDWHPLVAPLAGQAATSLAPQVNNDESLGADITGLHERDMASVLTGKTWARHDGFPTVDQSLIAKGEADPETVKWTLNDKSVDQGFLITAEVAQQGSDIKVTLTNANWYLRWIGVYLQFLDTNGKVIPVSQLPPDTIPDNRKSSNTEDALFGTMTPPEFTLFAIPVDAGWATLVFKMPPKASSVRILGSGLGFGSINYPDTVLNGAVMTIAVNFGLTTFFLAAGAGDMTSPFQKKFVVPIASLVAQEFATLLAADLKSSGGISSPGTWKSMGITLLKALLSLAGREAIRNLILAIITIVTEAALEDAIPIAGQILQAIAAIVGAADLLHSAINVLESPWTYVYEMVFTHDVSVNILHDPNNNKFPELANYYKVTALFDSGATPHTQTLDLPFGTTKLPPVVFKNVPLGGQINISTGFYSRSINPAKTDWLAGKGTTGLVSNASGQLPDLTIQEYKVPIRSSTVYVHTQKTALQADGSHAWTRTSIPPSTTAADIPCAGPGTLCDFRNISVRQGTSEDPGYVGYAWKGYSRAVNGCGGGGQGQFDQMANLNTGPNAQSGYANGPCGFPDGVRLAYNSGHSTANFYLDSAARIVRQVKLTPPSFDPPGGNRAWGKFNLDASAFLLHPTGKILSISNAESRIETLKIPPAALTDQQASVHLLAQTHSGPGSRPGLIDTPAAAAISADGVVLLLEQNNNRIQAFDTGANPVKFFPKQPKSYFLTLDATKSGDTVYLDLAVEFTGYLYVLSYNQASYLYRLDIYHQGQSNTNPISTTRSFNAAKLVVDFWRNAYTLNYELLVLKNGTAPGLTEPSVSMWVPQS